MTLSWSMDKIGPMARSSEDCAIVLETLSAGEFRRWDAPTAAERIQGLRIGYLHREVEMHAKPETRGRIEAGVRELAQCLGVEILPAMLPELPYAAMAATIHGAEGASVFEDLIHSPSFDTLSDESQKAGFRAAFEIPAIDYLRAQRLRTPLISEFKSLFERFDVLVSFGQARTAPLIGQRREDPDWWNAGLVPAGNLAGVPAIFFPCGLGTDHMPVGLQVVGPPRSEQLLVAVVDAYQRETEHNKLRPA
jgi:aspartyl-tRNA(Asn)/glutamyl-tRNA(Gln) amidotransferase subunit A